MKFGRPGKNVRKGELLRACRAILLALCCALAALSSARADAPVDVLEPTNSGEVSIPKPPEGYIEERVGQITWAFHPAATQVARGLEHKLPLAWAKVTSELGVSPPSGMTVRVARGPEDMARLAPAGAPPPRYAVGVAYPALGLVILSVVSPDSWLPPDLASVLTHELSHIAVYRAVDGHALPRWFVEGLAIHQANEQGLARVRTLWEAAVVGEILPLSELSQNFPARPHEVNRAYAQSADLVEHMLREGDGSERLVELLARVRRGVAFDQAVLGAYHIELAYLDREWRQALGERFRVLPLVLTGTALWGGIAILAVLAFVRRRRDHHAKLRRWGDEEAAHERAMAALELQRQMLFREELALRHGYSVPPPLPREPEVPTIEHDGQRHTLH